MKAMTLRLPDEIHERLRNQAHEQRTTVTSLILRALAPEESSPRLTCDACDRPHTMVTTPGGFRFCDEHPSRRP
jgi:predicted transcriptional regulator